MKRNLYVMYAIALLQGMVFYGPIATLYRQAQGVTVFQITVIESISLRMGARKSLFLFCVPAALACFLLARTQNTAASVAGVLTLRLSDTLFQPFQVEIQNRQIQTENRATALSIHSMIVNCIAIGTNLVFGALSDWSLPSAFLFGAGICGASLIFFLIWYHKAPGK